MITNQHIPQISMMQIYNVLKRDFPDYTMELVPVPEYSEFMVTPEWGRAYVEARHYIGMRSSANDILIQHQVSPSNKRHPFVGVSISYYLNGKNRHGRLDELKEPMEKIKKCLIDNFPEQLKEEDFTVRVRTMYWF
jgi:hypothetical protein